MSDAIVWLVMLVAIAAAFRSLGSRRRTRAGPAAAGAVYDWLNQDKRKAIEIVADGQAERRDGEHADGNLPELEHPAGSTPPGAPPAR